MLCFGIAFLVSVQVCNRKIHWKHQRYLFLIIWCRTHTLLLDTSKFMIWNHTIHKWENTSFPAEHNKINLVQMKDILQPLTKENRSSQVHCLRKEQNTQYHLLATIEREESKSFQGSRFLDCPVQSSSIFTPDNGKIFSSVQWS